MSIFKFTIIVFIISVTRFTFAFEIPWFGYKQFSSIEECFKFNARVEGQEFFMNLTCSNLFQSSLPITDTEKKRLLCMRREIDGVTSIEKSREVIFKCYDKYPSSNSGDALVLAKRFFPTQQEIQIEQMSIDAKRKLLQQSLPFSCFLNGSYINCN